MLAVNSGSSSVKFKLVEVFAAPRPGASHPSRVLIEGSIQEIGGLATLSLKQAGGAVACTQQNVATHVQAAEWMLESLTSFEESEQSAGKIEAVGHRIVHGGEQFGGPVRVDGEVLSQIEQLSELAPLHNPVGLRIMHVIRERVGPAVPMVVVFDTAFHHSLPKHSLTYAISHELAAKHRIRRYGFHGIAHASLAAGYSAYTGRSLDGVRLITLHLGNGCSAAAIRAGQSIDTSMGFTPLEGLVMGTRSGDLDPAVVSYLARKEGVSAEQVEGWLNERSGLLGVSGLSHDMRELLAAAEQRHDMRAELAIELFCYRARKYLGAYLAALGGADAVIFGGGIGEQAPEIRARICANMAWCGLELDPARNAAAVGVPAEKAWKISGDTATLAVFVVPVDEETWIARETARCLLAKTV